MEGRNSMQRMSVPVELQMNRQGPWIIEKRSSINQLLRKSDSEPIRARLRHMHTECSSGILNNVRKVALSLFLGEFRLFFSLFYR
jgi:hypothetical protein